MSKFVGFIIILALIFLVIAVLNGGFDLFKNQPIKQSVETGKDIVNTTKKVVEKTKDVIEVLQQPVSNFGKIPCVNDEDCFVLEECGEGSCYCELGYCMG